MAAALACFAESGFHGTTMAAVARRSGFTAPALYHYVADKHELYEAVAAHCIDRVWGELNAVVESLPTAREQMDAMFTTASRGTDPEGLTSRILLSMPVEASWEPRFAPILEDRSKLQFEIFSMIERTARSTGELATLDLAPGELAEILRMLFRGWAFDAFSEPAHRAERTTAVRHLLEQLSSS